MDEEPQYQTVDCARFEIGAHGSVLLLVDLSEWRSYEIGDLNDADLSLSVMPDVEFLMSEILSDWANIYPSDLAYSLRLRVSETWGLKF